MSHVAEGLLHAYADGALRPGDPEHEAVRDHLAACADCQVRLEEAIRLRDQAHEALAELRLESVDTPPFGAVVARAGLAGRRRASWRTTSWYMPLAWAASITVAVAAGWIAREVVSRDGPVPASVAEAGRLAPRPAAPEPFADPDEPRLLGIALADDAAEPEMVETEPSAGAEEPAASEARPEGPALALVSEPAGRDAPAPAVGLLQSRAAASLAGDPAEAAAARRLSPRVETVDPVLGRRSGDAPTLAEPALPPPVARPDPAVSPRGRARPGRVTPEAVVPAIRRAPDPATPRVAQPAERVDAAGPPADAPGTPDDTASGWTPRSLDAAARRLGVRPVIVAGERAPVQWAVESGPTVRVRAVQRLADGTRLVLVQWRADPSDAEHAPQVLRDGATPEGHAFIEVRAAADLVVRLAAPVTLDVLRELAARLRNAD